MVLVSVAVTAELMILVTIELLIWDSVKIDWENKKIICSLPLRGKESEFLSPPLSRQQTGGLSV